MHYVVALINRKNDEEFYRVYITDALKQISESIAKQSGGPYIKKRYYELKVESKKEEKKTEKSGDQIIAETIAKLGLHKAE